MTPTLLQAYARVSSLIADKQLLAAYATLEAQRGEWTFDHFAHARDLDSKIDKELQIMHSAVSADLSPKSPPLDSPLDICIRCGRPLHACESYVLSDGTHPLCGACFTRAKLQGQ